MQIAMGKLVVLFFRKPASLTLGQPQPLAHQAALYHAHPLCHGEWVPSNLDPPPLGRSMT